MARINKDKKDIVSFPEDLMSYEHCTVYEDHKENVEKKIPQLKCRECNNGVLKEAPSRIAISSVVVLKCNSCKSQLKCFKDYDKFEITKTACEECGCAQVRVNYPVKESPFPFYANQHTGCMYCDITLKRLVEFPESSTKPEQKDEKTAKTEEEQKDTEKDKQEESTPIIVVTKRKKKKKR